MFIDRENFDFEIADVLRFNRKKMYYSTEKRKIAVISCRLYGETTFYSDGESVHASKTEYVMIPSDTEYVQDSTEEEVICIHIMSDNALVDKITAFKLTSPEMQQYFLNIYDEWRRKKNGYMLKCKAITYNILYELGSVYSEDRKSDTERDFDKSMEYIYSNYRSKNFNIEQAIELSYLSPAYFRKIFKNKYNTSPSKFINSLKIEFAKSLLASRMYSVGEISEMAGFSDEKYFFALFKNLTGNTPVRWMKEN